MVDRPAEGGCAVCACACARVFGFSVIASLYDVIKALAYDRTVRKVALAVWSCGGRVGLVGDSV